MRPIVILFVVIAAFGACSGGDYFPMTYTASFSHVSPSTALRGQPFGVVLGGLGESSSGLWRDEAALETLRVLTEHGAEVAATYERDDSLRLSSDDRFRGYRIDPKEPIDGWFQVTMVLSAEVTSRPRRFAAWLNNASSPVIQRLRLCDFGDGPALSLTFSEGIIRPSLDVALSGQPCFAQSILSGDSDPDFPMSLALFSCQEASTGDLVIEIVGDSLSSAGLPLRPRRDSAAGETRLVVDAATLRQPCKWIVVD